MMTPQQFAQMLNGREYCKEITKEECVLAKQHGLVVMFGGSDDLMEIRGIVDDELSAWDGLTVHFNHDGLIENGCSDEDCPAFKKAIKAGHSIRQIWGFYRLQRHISQTV